MDILISFSDLEFLLGIVNDREIQELLRLAKCKGEYLAKDRYSTGKYFIRLSEDNCIKIQDSLGGYLAEFGVGDEGEIYSVGTQVEVLIDLFDPSNSPP